MAAAESILEIWRYICRWVEDLRNWLENGLRQGSFQDNSERLLLLIRENGDEWEVATLTAICSYIAYNIDFYIKKDFIHHLDS